MPRHLRWTKIAFASWLAAACGGSADSITGTTPPVSVASVGVTVASPSLIVGATTQVTATLKDGSGNLLTGRSVSWSSSVIEVATVSPSGLVSAIAPGTTTITGTSEGKNGSVSVTVAPIPVASVSVSLTAQTLTVGSTTQTTASIKDANGNSLTGRSITWSSSNSSVATVSGNGLVSAIGAGNTSISATSEGQTGAVALTVTPTPVGSVSVSLAASTVAVGATTQASAATKDASGNVLTGRSVIWASSNTSVATVNASGVVTAIGAGTASITATSEGQTGSAALTVTPTPVASVSVALAASILSPGSTTQATATTRDASGNILTGRAVTWASSNTTIATVSQSGLITAVVAGRATITASSEGQTGSETITVSTDDRTPPTLINFSFSPASIDVSTGNQTVTVTITASDAGVGVDPPTLYFYSPAPVQQNGCTTTLTSGTTANGTWTCTVTFTPLNPGGQWTASDLILPDRSGNYIRLTAADLQARGFPTTLTVTNTGTDRTPPTLVNFSFSPASIDVSTGNQTVTVTITASDAGVGIDPPTLYFYSPAPVQQNGCTTTLASGTIASGTWTCTIAFTPLHPGGQWTASDLILPDRSGNYIRLTAADLQARGFPTALAVANSGTDRTPPTLLNFAFSPASIDVSTGNQTVTVTITATDAGVGVDPPTLYFYSPAPVQQNGCTTTLTTGTIANGTWTCAVTFTTLNPGGQWTASDLIVPDRSGNYIRLTAADLQARGFPTALNVQK